MAELNTGERRRANWHALGTVAWVAFGVAMVAWTIALVLEHMGR